MNEQILVVTTNDVPGYQVTHVYGDVVGVITRSRNVVSNFGAGLKSIIGGEIKGYTKLVYNSRLEAVERMKENTANMGGNAVLAARFDSGQLAQAMNEVVAYGTAVKIEPIK